MAEPPIFLTDGRCSMFFRRIYAGVGALLLAVSLAGCGYGGGPMNGAAPNVSQLMPTSVMHGSAGFAMTVNGSNFGQDAVVYFNGNVLQTGYASTSQVSAQVPAADVAASGMANVYVRSNGQNSNIVLFTIQ